MTKFDVAAAEKHLAVMRYRACCTDSTKILEDACAYIRKLEALNRHWGKCWDAINDTLHDVTAVPLAPRFVDSSPT